MTHSIDVRAAGTVLWRERKGSLQVLLIHRPKWSDWSFPKGKLKAGETLAECAVRETTEEAGVAPVLGRPLGWQHYDLADGRHKEVRYWAATIAPSGSPVLATRPTNWVPNKGEIDDRRWLNASAAAKKLTREDDKKILSQLVRAYETGKLATTPVILLRHTRAKSRSAWATENSHATEHNRPLTKVGQARAQNLIGTLGAYGIEEVTSSPWKRCVDTVAPYTRALGGVVRVVDALTEAAFAADPETFLAWVRDQFLHANTPQVISLHRPTLQAVMNTLRPFTAAKVLAQVPKKDPWLKTGEMIIAHVAFPGGPGTSPDVVALERTRPVA
ncbi:8-oxo-dGTP diphosphatase [Arcanobacterium wilhelmae]|uniref:8-oxo-dGTP diphosphatase n=1 Tax=Arcanobacterium wilhelmae TaxID=1803177 RepID=A0ABT9NAW5_9ACTO|nr:NUDIX hydrolase [Arcanobacterium wilhelmae]MDP9800658.1 8-oxo-dGTP diphosphatase [Arcanobacterium wilhelmae]WFN90061.1 NUDIX hydrolase [Arcanobacterium wilhelmae]